MKKLITAAALAVLATGCITVNKNDGGSDCLKQPIAKDIVHQKYQVGDKTVTATDKLNVLFGWIAWGSTATHYADEAPGVFWNKSDVVKNGAYANACDAAKCDSIVGTRYTITVEDYFVFKKLNCEVTGYPAKLTGVEVIENKCPCVGAPKKGPAPAFPGLP